MNPVHEDIIKNYATKGKIMIEKQLMTLLSLVAEYDFKLPDMTGWSVRKASQVIDLTLRYIKYKGLKKRRRPYDVGKLLKRFISKYPELYDAIILGDR